MKEHLSITFSDDFTKADSSVHTDFAEILNTLVGMNVEIPGEYIDIVIHVKKPLPIEADTE